VELSNLYRCYDGQGVAEEGVGSKMSLFLVLGQFSTADQTWPRAILAVCYNDSNKSSNFLREDASAGVSA